MRSVGVVAATDLEAEVLLRRLGVSHVRTLRGKAFHLCGETLRSAVVVCVSGVGKVNAAHGTALLIEHFEPERVVSLGVAGAYPSAGLGLSDLVVVEREVYGDEGLLTSRGFVPLAQLGWQVVPGGECRTDEGFALRVPDALKGWRFRGTSVTVSSCTGTLERARYFEETYAALCENMEGAAVAHVGVACGVSVTELRGISNVIEDRAIAPLSRKDVREAAERVQEFFLDAFL